MGRPPLPVGMHGRIDIHHARSGRVRTRTRVRGTDGVLRAVTRWDISEAEASARLMVAVNEMAGNGDAAIGTATRLSSAVRVWLDELTYGLKERSWASTVATIAYFCWAFRLAGGPEPLRSTAFHVTFHVMGEASLGAEHDDA